MTGVPQLANRAWTWWSAPATARQAYAIAGAIGLLVYLIVYGPGHLFGTSAYWDMPQEDSRAYLMAYRHFVAEPWHWPIFTSHTINLPTTKSFALSDGIPIWALTNKAIATVIPPWEGFSSRAYLGLFHGVSHVLQACLGVAIMRLFGHRSRGATIVSAVFFLALPAWIFRYQHAALSAHFLILWPIYLYLRTPVRATPPRRLQIGWLCELAVVAMTNPYHVVISFGLFVAALVRSRRVRTLVWLPAALASIVLAAGLAGYLARATATKMGGFESYSTNMMSLFVAPNSGIVGDAREWFGEIKPIYNQYEGMTYMGLGLVILFLLFLPRARSLGGVIKRHPVLFAVALGAWFLALSNRIFFNSHLVLDYDVPSALHIVRDTFRAPGRFAYVPMYVLIVFLLQWAFTRFSSGWQRLVLPALAIVQLVDATGEWRFNHDYTRAAYVHKLPTDPWRTLVHAHETILEMPTFDCLDNDWMKQKPALEIAYYASERALPINGVYGARPVRDCSEDLRTFSTVELRDHTLYVWLTKRDRFARRIEALGARCGAFQYGWACSKDANAISEAIRGGALEPMGAAVPSPALAYGQRVTLGKGGTAQYVTDGWSWAEPGGRWSDGPVASLELQLMGAPPPRLALKLHATAPICGRRGNQDVDVIVNDVRVGTLRFTRYENDVEAVRTLPIPEAAMRPDGAVIIDFRPRDIRSPSKVRCNEEKRPLGVWVRELWFEAQP